MLPGLLPVTIVDEIIPGVVVVYFDRTIEMGDGSGHKAVLTLSHCEGPASDPLKGGALVPHTFIYHSGRRCYVANFEPVYGTGGLDGRIVIIQ